MSLQAEAGATVLFTLDGALESVLQQCAVCCRVLHCVAVCWSSVVFTLDGALESVMQQCAGCCIALQCVEAVC